MLTKLGKFEILKPLGKGAMGEVFLGKDPMLGREVAIKTIQAASSFGEEAKARFEREARIVGGMSHANIVTVYDFGQDQGVYYLVMEYVQGEELEHLIKRAGASKAELLEIMAQVCDGLAYAHDRGVIHRDIKPANVLVTKGKRGWVAKLTDFGVASVDSSNLTQDGTWMGTVNYMAPEYLDTGKATPATDVFAVGVMLYEAVAGGRKPFPGENVTMVLNRILRHQPDPLAAEDLADLSPAVRKVVERALAKDPSERFQSPEVLAFELRAALNPGTISGAVPLADLVPPELRQAASAPTAPSGPAPTIPGVPSAPRPAVPAAPGPSTPPDGTQLLKASAIPRGPAKRPADGKLVVSKAGYGNCLSIRVALRQAEPGATIVVMPGTYRESLVLDKEVHLVGEGEASEIVIEGLKGPAVVLDSPQATVKGMTLRTYAAEGEAESPTVLARSGYGTLEGCTLASNRAEGLRVQGQGTHPTLRKCLVHLSRSAGVRVTDGARVRVEQCVFEGHTGTGLAAEQSGQAELQQCVFRQAEGVGVAVTSKGQALLEGCFVEQQAGGGLEAEGEGRLTVRRTRVSGCGMGVLAFERSQVQLEECELVGNHGSAIHALAGANVLARQCQLHRNQGFGCSVMAQGLGTLDGCEVHANGFPGVLIHRGATVQVRNSKLYDNQSFGVLCAGGGQGVLENCELYGNVQSGAKVEPGGSLLLVRCVLRDGRDTGLLLLEDGQATLEECVIRKNARGGILLAKDASDPVLRGGAIEDTLLREGSKGEVVKLAPLKRG